MIGFIGADVPPLDPSFCTIGDYLFAKFIALERLRDIVVTEMQVPSLAGAGEVRSKKGKELRWTGDSCNLIELAYGAGRSIMGRWTFRISWMCLSSVSRST